MSPERKVLRASISLDGKLLTARGKPRRVPIPPGILQAAAELHLRIRPVLVGGGGNPSLSGLNGGFLPEDLRYELLSVTRGRSGIHLRYRRAGINGSKA